MTDVVLFHSAQGLRPGVEQWADAFREAGHRVWTPDLFEGATFDRLEDGVAHRDGIGIPELLRRARGAVDDLPSEVVYAGFSMGVTTAEIFAADRPGAQGAALMHGAIPLEGVGVDGWPASVPVEVHYAVEDPWVEVADEVDPFVREVRDAGAAIEVHTYPGSGHLFADPDSPDYDRESAQLMLGRVLGFLERVGGDSG
jgi:dienelactone hydrolase